MADIVQKTEAEACLHAGSMMGTPKVNPESEGRAYALVPEGATLEYLERPAFPPRRTGTVKLSDTASFLEYWKRQSTSLSYIYGSMVPAQFLAVLNEHANPDDSTDTEEEGLANWRDHRALYALTHSDEWVTWTGRNGKPFDGNEQFAYWLEENLFDILTPEPDKFMDIALNIRVRQDQVFGNKVNLNDGNIILQYQNVVEGTAQQTSGEKVAIPEQFEISIPVFKGLDSPKYTVEARFRYRLAGGKITLRYDLVRPGKVIEQAFKEMLAEIQKASGTTVLFGQPEV